MVTYFCRNYNYNLGGWGGAVGLLTKYLHRNNMIVLENFKEVNYA